MAGSKDSFPAPFSRQASLRLRSLGLRTRTPLRSLADSPLLPPSDFSQSQSHPTNYQGRHLLSQNATADATTPSKVLSTSIVALLMHVPPDLTSCVRWLDLQMRGASSTMPLTVKQIADA